MGFLDIFRRKQVEDLDAKRREFLLTKGRICDGTIIDSERSETGEEIAFYIYNIQGVDFESSEILTEQQKQNRLKRIHPRCSAHSTKEHIAHHDQRHNRAAHPIRNPPAADRVHRRAAAHHADDNVRD